MEKAGENKAQWNASNTANQRYEFVQVVGANAECNRRTNNCQKESNPVLHPFDFEAITSSAVAEKTVFHDFDGGEQHKRRTKMSILVSTRGTELQTLQHTKTETYVRIMAKEYKSCTEIERLFG